MIMNKLQVLAIFIVFFVPLSISQINAQSLYVDVRVGDMDSIEESKYKATGVSILRNSDGDLISVVRVDATRYLDDPIIDKFLESNPDHLVKKGVVGDKKITLYRVEVDHHYPECIEKEFEVPGYNDLCNWYHRAFVTMLGVTDEKYQYTIFRGLNHGFTLKPLDDVITVWHILSKD